MELDPDSDGRPAFGRRSVLALVGSVGLAGCLSNAPGATGPRNPPDRETSAPPSGSGDGGGGGGGGGGATDRPLQVETYDFEATDDGRLRVFGTVVNNTGDERSGVVRAGVFYGDQSNIQEQAVTVPGDGSTEFEFVFDVDFDTFAQDGELFVEASASE